MKVTTVEFNKFWDETLGRDWYDDGDEVDYEDLTALVTVEYTCPRWQGQTALPEPKGIIKQRDIDGDCITNVVSLFKRWRKSQTTSAFVVKFDVPNEERDAFLKQVEAMKGVVVK